MNNNTEERMGGRRKDFSGLESWLRKKSKYLIGKTLEGRKENFDDHIKQLEKYLGSYYNIKTIISMSSKKFIYVNDAGVEQEQFYNIAAIEIPMYYDLKIRINDEDKVIKQKIENNNRKYRDGLHPHHLLVLLGQNGSRLDRIGSKYGGQVSGKNFNSEKKKLVNKWKTVLGVSDSDNDATIRKKYRQLLKHHPNKGGRGENVQPIIDAWEQYKSLDRGEKRNQEIKGIPYEIKSECERDNCKITIKRKSNGEELYSIPYTNYSKGWKWGDPLPMMRAVFIMERVFHKIAMAQGWGGSLNLKRFSVEYLIRKKAEEQSKFDEDDGNMIRYQQIYKFFTRWLKRPNLQDKYSKMIMNEFKNREDKKPRGMWNGNNNGNNNNKMNMNNNNMNQGSKKKNPTTRKKPMTRADRKKKELRQGINRSKIIDRRTRSQKKKTT